MRNFSRDDVETLPNGHLFELVEQYAPLKPDLYLGTASGGYWQSENLVSCRWDEVKARLLRIGNSHIAFQFSFDDGTKVHGEAYVHIDVVKANTQRVHKRTSKNLLRSVPTMTQTEIAEALPFGIVTATKKVKAWVTTLEPHIVGREPGGRVLIEMGAALKFISQELEREANQKAKELEELKKKDEKTRARLLRFLEREATP